MDATRGLLVVLAIALFATPALAHVPEFPDDNTSPERALAVPDAAKSWSFYDRLEPGQPKYYRFSLADGQRMRFGTFTAAAGDFTPSVVLLGESVSGTGQVPSGVAVPEGMGAVVFEGDRPDVATYEPFTPSANYHTVSVDQTLEEGGTYLLAVYEPQNRSGPVGVTIGYEEEFSAVEYATVPFDRVRIHRWEGQHPLLIAFPWLVTLIACGALVRVRGHGEGGRPAIRYALLGAGAVVLGAGVSTLVQLGLALRATGPTAGVLVTAAFIAVPAVGGAWVLRVSLRDEFDFGVRTRAGLALVAAASLLTWAGFVVGPVVMLAAAVIPTRWGERG